MGNEKTFSSAQEMLNELESCDLYNETLELYIFLYNEEGSIASYSISKKSAKALANEAGEAGEAWSALIGPGGYIYDEPVLYLSDIYHVKGWVEADEHTFKKSQEA